MFLCCQVLIKPKPMTFQTAVVSEHTRQLVSETLQQVARPSDAGAGPGQEGAPKDESPNFTESSSPPSESMHSAQGRWSRPPWCHRAF